MFISYQLGFLTNTNGYSSKYFSGLYTDEFALRKEAEAHDIATFYVSLVHLTIRVMLVSNGFKKKKSAPIA